MPLLKHLQGEWKDYAARRVDMMLLGCSIRRIFDELVKRQRVPLGLVEAMNVLARKMMAKSGESMDAGEVVARLGVMRQQWTRQDF